MTKATTREAWYLLRGFGGGMAFVALLACFWSLWFGVFFVVGVVTLVFAVNQLGGYGS